LFNYYRIKEDLDRSNQEIGTGKKLIKPSDDPINVARSIVARSTINKINQFNKNINFNLAYSKEVQLALSGVEDILIDIKTQTIKALNDTMEDEERQMLSDYILGNIEDLKSIANTKYMGKSLFTGFETSKKAYTTSKSNVVNLDSLPSMILGTEAVKPFGDLPELDRGIYNITIDSDSTDITISMTDEYGNVIQLDDDGNEGSSDEGGNKLADSLFYQNAAGKRVNIGRGIEIEFDSTLTAGTQTFKIEYSEDGSMVYHGDVGEYKTRIMDDTLIPLSVPGNKIFQGDRIISTRFIDDTNGFTVPSGNGDVTFTIGDGETISSNIVLTEGTTYTRDDILDLLDNAGIYIGENDNVANTVNVKASFDENGHLNFGYTNEAYADRIIIREYSDNPNNLENTLGIKTGTYKGQDIFDVLTDVAEMIENNTFRSKIENPSPWNGSSVSEVTVGGSYTGDSDNTFLFTVDATGGTVGVTSGMTITVTDQSSGDVVAVLDVGENYEAYTDIDVTDGMYVSFSPYSLAANDSFTVSAVSERDRLERLEDALEQVTAQSVKVGYNIDRLEAAENRLKNLNLTLTEELSNMEDADIAESYVNYQSDEISYNAMMQLHARFQNLTLLNFI